MGTRDLAFLVAVAAGAWFLVGGRPRTAEVATPGPVEDLRPIVDEVDASFRGAWEEGGIAPAPKAADLVLMRRLSLALTGTVPSLEAIRRFEARSPESRVDAWLDELLADRRAADYLAERMARVYVGTEDGPFLLFRRRRFTTWLSDAIAENRPYDAIVRELITETGLWTDKPATNFVTVTYDPDAEVLNPERLAARVSRAFLGARIDCAQCHDHPFQPWKQDDFRGLTAFFGGTHSSLRGIRDGENTYRPAPKPAAGDPKGMMMAMEKGKEGEATEAEPPVVDPRVPFLPGLLPESGNPRERLASWVVDPGNPSFARATVNRFWALLFGLPLSDPVDDLPPESELHPALVILARDFAAHGYDLKRLVRTIAATEAFRLDSADPSSESGPSEAQEAAWAAFPMTRLRPEQVAGSITQATSLSTLGPQSPWLVRLAMYTSRNDFVSRYGDTGQDEFDARGGTIPQRLLLMNGEMVKGTGDGFFEAATRVAMLAPDDRRAVEVSYLTILARRPTPEESDHFAAKLEGSTGEARKERTIDLFWTLLNTTEFSWNH